MQYAGKKIDRYTGRVSIGRIDEETGELYEISILVKQLPLGWAEECERQLPQPRPPIIGKVYDKQGRETPKYNEDDPGYRAELSKWEHRTWAKKIHDATIDPGITWETVKGDDIPAFYDGIYAELAASFSRSEVSTWMVVINGIDQVGGADILLAQEGLSRFIRDAREVQTVAGHEAAGAG